MVMTCDCVSPSLVPGHTPHHTPASKRSRVSSPRRLTCVCDDWSPPLTSVAYRSFGSLGSLAAASQGNVAGPHDLVYVNFDFIMAFQILRGGFILRPFTLGGQIMTPLLKH